jgi:hypothetical protein
MFAITVNAVTWAAEERPAIPAGWPVVNAPRPLCGEITWTGRFRHGIFYAAHPEKHPTWDADDGWPVKLITNEEITALMTEKLTEHGYATAEEAGLTIAELAASYSLPWHEVQP